MILAAVAFVLAAAVLLGIGVVVDAGTVFVWASIGAGLMAFAVLGIRAGVRRRGRDTDADEAGSMADGGRETATGTPVRDDGGAVPAGFAAVDLDDDEPTVTILRGGAAGGATSGAAAPAREAAAADTPRHASFLDEASDEPTVTVFRRRRVRHAAVGAEEPTPVAVPASDEVDAPDAADDPDEPDERAAAADPGPPAPTPAAAARPKVVRRVVRSRDESTSTVVQLVVTADGTIGRRVVRRSSANPARTVRRVVRKAADAEASED